MKYINYVVLGVIIWSCSNNLEVEKGYFDNGNLKFKADTKGEFLHGEVRFYYEDGTLKRYSHYVRDTLHGDYIEYYQNGNMKAKGGFIMGVQSDSLFQYDSSGHLTSRSNYKNGELSGQRVSYYKDGTIKMRSLHERDSTIYYEEFDEAGAVDSEFRQIDSSNSPDTVYVGDTLRSVVSSSGWIRPGEKVEVLCYRKNMSEFIDKDNLPSYSYSIFREENGEYYVELLRDLERLYNIETKDVSEFESSKDSLALKYYIESPGDYVVLCKYRILGKDGTAKFVYPFQFYFTAKSKK